MYGACKIFLLLFSHYTWLLPIGMFLILHIVCAMTNLALAVFILHFGSYLAWLLPSSFLILRASDFRILLLLFLHFMWLSPREILCGILFLLLTHYMCFVHYETLLFPVQDWMMLTRCTLNNPSPAVITLHMACTLKNLDFAAFTLHAAYTLRVLFLLFLH